LPKKEQLVCETIYLKHLFKTVSDAVKSNVDDNDTAKLMNHMLSRMLGKTIQKHYKVRIDSEIEGVWNYMVRSGALKKDIFIKPFTLDNGINTHLYGIRHESVLSEHNTPMYIQITNLANMRLYDMIKQMGGTLAFIKTDCALQLDRVL
jgi:hypothetical protein